MILYLPILNFLILSSLGQAPAMPYALSHLSYSQLAGSGNTIKHVAGSLSPTHEFFIQYFLHPGIQLKTGLCGGSSPCLRG